MGGQRSWLAVLGLTALVGAAYGHVARFGFVNWDDYLYVAQNGYVRHGLTLRNLVWALTTTYGGNYHPLTWLSFMIDCQIFGVRPAGHHLVSVLWHLANTLLLFGFLRAATGAAGRSFFAAALFAVHPLHVESVAWISERKDVFSTFFWIAGLWAYLRWVKKRTVWTYALVAGAFMAGALAKPMLVTFPLTLLLLDFWPLRRRRGPGGVPARQLVREKLVLVLLVPAIAATALTAQKAAGALASAEEIPLGERLANAAVAIGQYLRHLFVPTGLSPIYPYAAGQIAWGALIVSVLVLVAVSAAAWRMRERAPYVIFGWAWLIVTLVPVLGLLQVGAQAWADRYTYVPYIGPLVAIVWLAADLAERRPVLRRTVPAAGVAATIVLVGLARAETFVWRDDPSLFGRVVDRFPAAFEGHDHLGDFYRTQGRLEEAAAAYRRAIAARPDRFDAWTNIGVSLRGLGRLDEARAALEKACSLNPRSSVALANLAELDEAEGRTTDAERGYRNALDINPLEEQSLLRLAVILADRGELQPARELVARLAALVHEGWASAVSLGDAGALCVRLEMWAPAESLLGAALAETPDDATAWSYLGLARQRLHEYAPAVDAYARALALEPRMAGARFNLGVACLQTGDFARAESVYADLRVIDAPTAERLMQLINEERERKR